MGPLIVFGASVVFAFLEELVGTRRSQPEEDASYGAFPGPASASDVLRSAALAPAGSWTQRDVLQAGAANSWQRRVAGDASEADFAVLRAARPGIASSASGPISAAWSRSPWMGSGEGIDVDALADQVLDEMDD